MYVELRPTSRKAFCLVPAWRLKGRQGTSTSTFVVKDDARWFSFACAKGRLILASLVLPQYIYSSWRQGSNCGHVISHAAAVIGCQLLMHVSLTLGLMCTARPWVLLPWRCSARYEPERSFSLVAISQCLMSLACCRLARGESTKQRAPIGPSWSRSCLSPCHNAGSLMYPYERCTALHLACVVTY